MLHRAHYISSKRVRMYHFVCMALTCRQTFYSSFYGTWSGFLFESLLVHCTLFYTHSHSDNSNRQLIVAVVVPAEQVDQLLSRHSAQTSTGTFSHRAIRQRLFLLLPKRSSGHVHKAVVVGTHNSKILSSTELLMMSLFTDTGRV